MAGQDGKRRSGRQLDEGPDKEESASKPTPRRSGRTASATPAPEPEQKQKGNAAKSSGKGSGKPAPRKSGSKRSRSPSQDLLAQRGGSAKDNTPEEEDVLMEDVEPAKSGRRRAPHSRQATPKGKASGKQPASKDDEDDGDDEPKAGGQAAVQKKTDGQPSSRARASGGGAAGKAAAGKPEAEAVGRRSGRSKPPLPQKKGGKAKGLGEPGQSGAVPFRVLFPSGLRCTCLHQLQLHVTSWLSPPACRLPQRV